MKYSYQELEEAYYSSSWALVKEIGLELLYKRKDKYSKELYKELKEYEINYIEPNKSNILEKVKIWLMVNREDI